MKKVMVLGCDGYLGHALTLRLLKEGYEVCGVDDLSRRSNVEKVMNSFPAFPINTVNDRYNSFKKIGNLYDISYDSISYIMGNAYIKVNVSDLFKVFCPDVVVNLAQQPSAPFSHLNDNQMRSTTYNNVMGTLNVIQVIKNNCPDAHLIQIGCYDKETEILTKDGWKYFEEMTLNDEVMCLDKENMLIEYHKPSEIQKYKYEGDMVSIKNKRIDCLLTPNHRIVYKENKDGNIQIKRSDEINGCEYIPKNAGEWKGEYKEFFEIPSCEVRGPGGRFFKKDVIKIPMNIWLKFFGFWIGDGTLVYKKGLPVCVRISVSKDREVNFMRELQKEFPLKIYFHEKKGRNGMIEFEISNGQLCKYLATIGKTREKFIPEEIKKLPPYQLEYLIEGLMNSDGSINEWKTYRYDTISQKLRDDIQEIAIKTGRSNSCSDDRGCWYNYMTKNNDVFINKDNISKVKYDDYVHCCTVPTGIIMVRRNGRTYWSGNSMGEYQVDVDTDIAEGVFEFEYNGRKSKTSIFPRRPGSIYHSSKVASTYLLDCACRFWGMRVVDIMQGVVYGNWTPEIEETGMDTRLDSDEAFGTVVNRFIVQSIIGHPLTVFGKGLHKRGFLALNDSIQCLMLAIENKPEKGEYVTWNQLDEVFSMDEIADTVQKTAKNHGFFVDKMYIESPRKEVVDNHYYNPITDKLTNLGFEQTRTVEDEAAYIFKRVQKNPTLQDRISKLERVVIPKTTW